MKVSNVVLLATAALAEDVNKFETTVVVTKSGWDPKATHVYGRFDHTTRVHTTTTWLGSAPTNVKRADSVNATNGTTIDATGAAGSNAMNWGVVGGVLAVGALLV